MAQILIEMIDMGDDEKYQGMIVKHSENPELEQIFNSAVYAIKVNPGTPIDVLTPMFVGYDSAGAYQFALTIKEADDLIQYGVRIRDYIKSLSE